MKPVTVPIRPSTKQDSAINQPEESLSIASSGPAHLNFSEYIFLPNHRLVSIKIPSIKNPIRVVSSL